MIIYKRILAFIALTSPNINVTASSGDISAITSTEWDALSSSLSTDASLHALQNSDYDICRGLGTDAYAISDAANGICMHSHDCAFEFCVKAEGVYDLPSYSVDVRTEGDISKVRVTLKERGQIYSAFMWKGLHVALCERLIFVPIYMFEDF